MNLLVTAAMPRPSPAIRAALWAAQIVLAGMFALAGFMKATLPPVELVKQMPYAADLPLALMRFIGASELAGALGVILPAATRIRPGLTPLAAAALLTVMILASAFHLSRGETYALPINAGLGLLAAFVAWGRYKAAPIAARG